MNRKHSIEGFNEDWMPEPFSGCWLWSGGTTGENGYGVTSRGESRGIGRQRFAHRVSWEIHRGEIPIGMCVLHKCDTRLCVNPDHLFLGTRTDNVLDCVSKGRHYRGERHHRAKLTETNVATIRDRYASAKQTVCSMSAEFSVSQAEIYRIIAGQAWKAACQ